MHIDHTTLRTNQIEATRDYFFTVFDLKTGKRSDIIEKNIPGFWLYADEYPIVHIIRSAARFINGNNTSGEAIDHTAFFIKDYDKFKNKLTDLIINHSSMELPDIDEKRIFLHTPTGILLETVFRND